MMVSLLCTRVKMGGYDEWVSLQAILSNLAEAASRIC